jgi:hypothetical protein
MKSTRSRHALAIVRDEQMPQHHKSKHQAMSYGRMEDRAARLDAQVAKS